MGCAWIPPTLVLQLDNVSTACEFSTRSARCAASKGCETVAPRSAYRVRPTELLSRTTAQHDTGRFAAALGTRRLSTPRLMWGSDLPHDEEALNPFTRETLASDDFVVGMSQTGAEHVLAGTAVEMYGIRSRKS